MSNRIVLSLIGIFLVIATVGLWAVGFVQFGFSHAPVSLNTIRLAVIDVAKINQDADVFKNLKRIMDQRYSILHDEILSEETKLRQEQEELQNFDIDNNKSRTKELSERREALARKIAQLEEKVQQKKETMAQHLSKLNSEIDQEFHHVLDDYVKEKEIDVVIAASAVLYGQSFDITQEVLMRLNDKTKNLAIDIPTLHLEINKNA